MILIMGGSFLKLLCAFAMILLHLKPALAFNSDQAGDTQIRCIERERQALLVFKQGLVDEYGKLSSWGSEDQKKNCCEWKGVHCSNHTGHVLRLDLHNYDDYSKQLRDFGYNKFSGKLPAWIGEGLAGLYVLILRSNKFHGSISLQLCYLSQLQILDLSLNEISGTIPQCLNNISSMAQKGDLSEITVEYNDGNFLIDYLNSAMVALKGRESEYGKILGLLRIINLSNNKLVGNLPSEILRLLGLTALNISRNNLTGRIPEMIGQLNQLESLDLSRNHFSGEIPSSISDLNFLSYLDLSYNNLSGKIPPGTQIQGFNASVFAENDGLCGTPLTKKCPGEEMSNSREPTNGGSGYNQEDGDEFEKWFYTGMGLGFGVAFWGVCGTLLLKRSWRDTYFIFLDNMKDWLYVTMAVNKARLKMKFQSSA